MKKISILSLFPDVFISYINHSIIKKAINNKLVDVEIINFRDYSSDKHKKVDDTPYGGGPGMVLSIEPIVKCLKQIKTINSCVILTTPSGHVYNQKYAHSLAQNYEHLIIICGHYEGIDERIYHYINLPLSIGDYILTGGETPALVILDSVVRLIEGTISQESLVSESFNNHLLDYPVYTKPVEFDNHKVPDVLLSGNHQKINEYRLQEQIKKTKKYRVDLIKKYNNSTKGEKYVKFKNK